MVVEHVNLDVGVHMVSNTKKILSLIVSCFLFITTGFAQDNTCKDVNLWPHMWKVRDQGNTGTCFAHAAAYAADYAFGKKFRPNDPWRVSAYDLAIRSGIIKPAQNGDNPMLFDPHIGRQYLVSGFRGGEVELALKAGLQGGFCDHKRLASDSNAIFTDLNTISSIIFNMFKPDIKWNDLLKNYREVKTFQEKQKIVKSISDIYRPIIEAGKLDVENNISPALLEQLLLNCSGYLIKAGDTTSDARKKCDRITGIPIHSYPASKES